MRITPCTETYYGDPNKKDTRISKNKSFPLITNINKLKFALIVHNCCQESMTWSKQPKESLPPSFMGFIQSSIKHAQHPKIQQRQPPPRDYCFSAPATPQQIII